jgi:translation initiation factor 3 subunit A
VKFDRKKEFRNLCETLRKHFQQIGKYANQINPISMHNPESLQICIETRLDQLGAAAQMELWQEAFKTAEDISALMASGRRRPRPQILAIYFQHLASVCSFIIVAPCFFISEL